MSNIISTYRMISERLTHELEAKNIPEHKRLELLT